MNADASEARTYMESVRKIMTGVMPRLASIQGRPEAKLFEAGTRSWYAFSAAMFRADPKTGFRSCVVCHTNGVMSHCPGCRLPFCSKACQKEVWKKHKLLCKDYNRVRTLQKYLSPDEFDACFNVLQVPMVVVGLERDPASVVVCPGPSCAPGNAVSSFVRDVDVSSFVRDVGEGGHLTSYGDFKQQIDFVFTCQCGQSPCEHRVPANWRTSKRYVKMTRFPAIISVLRKAHKAAAATGEAGLFV
jgi:hypothetical protein